MEQIEHVIIGGLSWGGIEGLLYASPPSILSALVWDYIWFGLGFPTVKYLSFSRFCSSENEKENLRQQLYVVEGPEYTLAAAIPHIVVSNALYLAKYVLFG